MKLSKDFDLHELVHPDFIEVLGDRAALLICPKLIETIQYIRDKLQAPIKINDWHKGGKFKSSGLRPLHDVTGSKISMHKTGHAADLKFSGMKPDVVYFNILNNPEKYPYVTRMENIEHTPTWLHLECSDEPRVGEIKVFNPK